MRVFRRAALFLGLAGGILAGCATQPAPTMTSSNPAGPPRSIALHHLESGDTVAVTYWTGTAYDPDAMRRINDLFRDRRNDDQIAIDPGLIDFLADLRDRLGLPPEQEINLTSCYRSKATNVALARSNGNVAENSYHMRGQAVDFHIPGVPLAKVAEEAAALRRGGYALYAAHVHVDTGPFRTWTPKGMGGDTMEARANPKKVPAKLLLAKAKPGKQAPARVQVASATPPKKPVGGKTAKPVKVATAPKSVPTPPQVKVMLSQLSINDDRAVREAPKKK